MKLKKHRKYSIFVLFFMFLAIIIAFTLVGQSVSNLVFEQACLTNLEIHKQTKTSITSLLEDAKFVSISILGNEGVVDMMRRSNVYSTQIEIDKYRLGFTFSSLFASRDYLDSISVFNDQSVLIQFGRMVEKEDMSRAEEISNLKGRILWTGAEFYPYPIHIKQANAVVSLYRALNDLYAMDQLGYQRISIKESSIYEQYESFDGEDADVFIVNMLGEVVSAGNKQLLGANLSGKSCYPRFFENKEGYFVSDSMVYSYYHVSNPDWCVVRVIPVDLVMSGARAFQNILMICMILCIAFVVLFFWLQRKAIQIEEGYKSKLLNREIELKYLQGQINPHFLYNTLDTIRWMAVKNGQTAIAEQTKSLSDVFRHTLNKGKELTTVEKEIDLVKRYMCIQQNRFEDRIKYQIAAENDCLDLVVPNLILQPLVENAVVHGLECMVKFGKIVIAVYTKADVLYYEVEDNGVGFNPNEIKKKMEDPKEKHEVFALKNIDERLKLMYGEEFGLTLISRPGEGSKIIVKLKVNR